jgi:hypothetical protein
MQLASRRRWRIVQRLIAPLLLVTAHQDLSASEAWAPQSAWRIERGVVAPWAPARVRVPPAQDLAGQSLRFTGRNVVGPTPLACAQAGYEFIASPAEGMFQGNLPSPAAAAARRLGVRQLPVLSMRVSCDGGVFDYHLVSRDKILLGLDNIVWTLARAGRDESPEAAVLELMRVHLGHDMRFDPATVAHKRAQLTRGLRNAIAGYFRRPLPAGEVPPIDGDPFTDSQEYPARFALGRARLDNARAAVPVRWQDDSRSWVVEVLLLEEDGRWRVDDLNYGRAQGFRALLKK